MATNALKNMTAATKAAKTSTPQTVRTPGRTDEVKNNAGGFVFTVSDVSRLERFLILGTDGGTYYVGEKKLTTDNAKFVSKMIADNERLVVDTLVDVSVNARAYSNSPALFVLALVMTEGKDKAYAREAVQKVARTSTQLFEFAQYIDDLGGWGRAKRKAVANWYESKDADQLAYQAVKYRQRNGWTHRDLMRLSHPEGVDVNVGNFILGKESSIGASATIDAFRAVQGAETVKGVIAVLKANKNLPWEAIPTQFLTEAEVWKTLFYNGAIGQTALLRNVTRFQKIGAFDDLIFAGDVAKRLADKDAIVKGKMHPVAYLNALSVYQNGRLVNRDGYGGYGQRQKDWTTNAKIAGAIEAGYYESFATITPAGKRTMASIDTSGSMTWWGPAGLVGLDCMQAAAAMAMVLVRSEPYVTINGFSTDLHDLGISASDSLTTVTNKLSSGWGGGTDCAQPMVVAKDKRWEIDTFTVWTDNETWAGRIKPSQALEKYRQSSGIDARLAVVGMVATPFTIADPLDRGMMDFVGFDSNAPRVLADFSAGRL